MVIILTLKGFRDGQFPRLAHTDAVNQYSMHILVVGIATLEAWAWDLLINYSVKS